MSVAIQSCVPCSIMAGDTIIFDISNITYPNSSWTLDFVLSRKGERLSTTRAATNGAGYRVTIAIAESAKLTPGPANYSLVYTDMGGTQRVTDWTGNTTILPDPAKTIPQSDAAKALKAANEALAVLMDPNLAPYSIVNFNGQGFTSRNMKELMDARDRLRVTVDAEMREMGIAGTMSGSKVIQTRFR